MAETKKIATIGGDGIGPEVVAQGVRILEAVAGRFGHDLDLVHLDLGADRFLRDGTTFPEETKAMIENECDAVLLGALGDPRVPSMEHARDILFGLRFGLDLYCNFRPVHCIHDRLMPLRDRSASDCQISVFRENTEGLYVGVGGNFKKGTPDEIAIQESINTRKGVERVIVAAFEHAKSIGAKTVHMADKHNALPQGHGLWLRTFREIAERYDGIEAKHVFVDALCLFLIQDPSQFEVIVTCNLFGDIVTDLGAALQGGMGMSASGNVHPGKVSMFEPVHGSAPPLAGKDIANPFATILSAGMMLTHLGLEGEELLTNAVRGAIADGECTTDVGGQLGTVAAGDAILRRIEAS